eukprot:CAMPEP_0115001792 /NCGR_PEP_ID=MMETSP0216-20121206/17606_1 /TAXON_ID=223996 /ORGANISM="Protocruzia adherens, Strain Boccale" /LENGTH=244 /DNA_ID=CAMNT_0002367233 /DNA_START=85 /DNA_END=819 /DNA_ORIENTATION=+
MPISLGLQPINLSEATQPIFVGISGGSGAGKSELCKLLEKKFLPRASVLRQDYFYKINKLNYDEPDSVDWEEMEGALNDLRNRKAVTRPLFDKNLSTYTINTVKIRPADIIFVEGTLVFSQESLRNKFNFKVYIDCDADVRLSRRVMTDIKIGKSLSAIVSDWAEFVKPAYEKYTERTKRFADIVLLHYPSASSNGSTVDFSKSTLDVVVNVVNAHYDLQQKKARAQAKGEISSSKPQKKESVQ